MVTTNGLSCGHSCRPALLGFLLLLGWTALGRAQTPEWIWDDQPTAAKAGEVRFFRKTFLVGFKAQRAELTPAGDDEITVYLNGLEVARSVDWKKPLKL